MRPRFWVTAPAILVATATATAAEPPPSSVRVLAPPADRVAVGPTRFEVQFDSPAGRQVVSVRLFVDGRPLAVLNDPPYAAVFDAGDELRAHTLRAEVLDDAANVHVGFATTLYVSYVEEVDVQARAPAKRAVLVSVVDGRLRPVTDLESDEWTLRIDRARELVLQAALDERPLAAALLLDASGSTIPYWRQIQAAADRFLARLEPGVDGSEVSIFAGTSVSVAPFGRDHHKHRAAVLALTFDGPIPGFVTYGSRVLDALARSVESVNVRPGQRSIAVFTDSLDTGSDLDFEQLADVVHRAGIRIDVIRFGRGAPRTEQLLLIRQMRALARESGGWEWRIRGPEDIGPTFELLARQLQQRYRLVFAPEPLDPGAARFRRLRTRVARRGVRVLAPARYLEAVKAPLPD